MLVLWPAGDARDEEAERISLQVRVGIDGDYKRGGNGG